MTNKLFIYLGLTLLFIGCVPEDKVKLSGLKDKTAPVISLSNLPTIINASSSSILNISVTSADKDFSHYIYKLGNASLNCADTSGYSAEVLPSVAITNDVSSFSSNSQSANTKLCVIAIDTNSNSSRPVSATWLVDTTAPLATLAGTPSLVSNASALNITVSATDIATYRYKVGESATTDCSLIGGYSAAIPRATLITDDVSLLSDDEIRVCVVGIDYAGNEQDLASATSYEWTKDSLAPTAVLSGVPSIIRFISSTVLNIGVTATVPADILSYQYKIGTAVLDCADPLLYSSNNLIITNITDDIASFTTNTASNNTKICVLAVDAAGNVQDYSVATTASWLTDIVVPVATLTNAPVGDNLDSVLNISVNAVVPADIVTYKYKLGTSTLDCSVAGGYSAAISKATNITNSLTGYTSGTTIKICVLALDSAGNQQAFASATTTSWTRYTACNNAAASFGGGFGAVKVPYLIYNVTQLQQVKNNTTCAYKLMSDIDLGGVTFTPIGTNANSFRGIFDGNNHTISNWTYSAPTGDYVGLFGYTNNSTMKTTIKDLTVVNINLTARNYVGGLVGYASTTAIIRSSVSGTVTGSSYVGGLVGQLPASINAAVFNSSSSVNVTGSNYIGGLIGYVTSSSSGTSGIKDSYSTGNVTASAGYAGGLIGYLSSSNIKYAFIENTYSSGTVTATHPAGLASYFQISSQSRAIKNSFTVSPISGVAGGVGKTISDSTGPNIPLEGIYWDITRSGKSFCLTATNPAGCSGVNSANSNPNYFYNSTNAPFFSSATQNWNTTQVWNFTGSSFPTLRLNSPVAPVATNISASGTPNQSITINMANAGFSYDGLALTYEILTPPTKGSLSSVTSTGAVYRQTDAHDYGGFTDSFTIRAVDSNGLTSKTATVTVTISTGCDPISPMYPGGNGTVGNPYLISSAAQLINIHKSGNCSYRLISDIDLSGQTFLPFATNFSYSGTFDGDDYEISNWTFTGAVSGSYVGFISQASGATIRDLTLTNFNLDPSTTSAYYFGVLSGSANSTTILNVHASGSIADTSGYVGGLVGYSSYSTIGRSSTDVLVQGNYNSGGFVAQSDNSYIYQSFATGNVLASYGSGGFIGYMSSYGGYGVHNCYATGNVSAQYGAGGFVGSINNYNTSGYEIQNSYSSGNVHSEYEYVGGFIGSSYTDYSDTTYGIVNSFSTSAVSSDYANTNGFAGQNSDDYSSGIPSANVYWDVTRSGQADCNIDYYNVPYSDCYGVNIGNSEPNYFFNNSSNPPLDQWDFSTIWRANPGALPTLR
jgi:hypothetical protein